MARAQDGDGRDAVRRKDRDLTDAPPSDPFHRCVEDVEPQLGIRLDSTVDAELGGALGVGDRHQRT